MVRTPVIFLHLLIFPNLTETKNGEQPSPDKSIIKNGFNLLELDVDHALWKPTGPSEMLVKREGSLEWILGERDGLSLLSPYQI